MDISKALREQFSFLDREYGLKSYRVPADKWDKRWAPSVGYANQTTGVYVEFDVRDSYLNVTLHQLQDGKFPLQGGRIASGQGYPLNSVIYLSDPSDLVYPLVGTGSSKVGAISMNGYVAEAAAKLKRHADDFLRGDFSRSPLISRATQEIFENSRRKT
jgi:hypothetical protein